MFNLIKIEIPDSPNLGLVLVMLKISILSSWFNHRIQIFKEVFPLVL